MTPHFHNPDEVLFYDHFPSLQLLTLIRSLSSHKAVLERCGNAELVQLKCFEIGLRC